MQASIYRALLSAGASFLIVYAPIARGAVKPGTLMPLLIVETLMVFGWLIKANNAKVCVFKRTALDLPIAAFAVVTAVSFIFSIYKYESLISVSQLAGYAGLYYLIVNEFTHTMRRFLIWLSVAVAASLSLYGLLQYFGILEHPWWSPKGMLASTYVNHNHFAGLLELAIPAVVGLIARYRRKPAAYPFLIPAAVIMAGAFILAQSRGAWASLVIAGSSVGAFFIYGRPLGKKDAVVIALVLLAVLAFLYFGKDVIAGRVDAYSIIYGEELSLGTRFEIWRSSIDMILHSPLVGCGIGTFAWAFPHFRHSGLAVQANFAHNEYIQLCAEAGILGLIVSLWMILLIMREAYRRSRYDVVKAGCAVGIFSLVIHGLSDFNFHIPANMILFTIYTAIVTSRSHSGEDINA